MTTTTYGIVLTPEGYAALGDLIDPYVKQSKSIGRYIYASSAQQNGAFLVVEVTPEDCATVNSTLHLFIPLAFVLFMATGAPDNPVGFGA